MSRKYKFGEKSGANFISFANVNWIDVFTRDAYFWCIIESLDFCRKNKEMELYGYCIMPSHIHLIFRSSLNDPIEWKYSSARNYGNNDQTVLEIDIN